MSIEPHIWIVGQWRAKGPWEVQGFFDSEDKARAACTGPNHFYAGGIPLNQALPDETRSWEENGGKWGGYPMAEEPA